MKRRDFMQLSAAGLATGLIVPALAGAEPEQPSLATADIYYTKGSLGRWKGKEAGHLPSIEVSKADGKATVKVVTAHEMKGYEHYIVKHVLLDSNHQYLAEHLFNPMEEKAPISTFTLDNYSGVVYALSLCNKHDLWLSSAVV